MGRSVLVWRPLAPWACERWGTDVQVKLHVSPPAERTTRTQVIQGHVDVELYGGPSDGSIIEDVPLTELHPTKEPPQ